MRSSMKKVLFALGMLYMPIANAGLLLTLSDNGVGGVEGHFVGSGYTNGDSVSQTAQFFNIGEYTTAAGPLFQLDSPLEFAGGRIILAGISDDSSTPDDFGFIVDTIVAPSTYFEIDATTEFLGLSYADLLPGVYTTQLLGGIQISDFTLVIESNFQVTEPGTTPLFFLGVLGFGIRNLIA